MNRTSAADETMAMAPDNSSSNIRSTDKAAPDGTPTAPLLLPDVTVDGTTADSLCRGAAQVVVALRPDWQTEDLLFKVYTDGITNKLVGVWHKEGRKDDQLLVRVYGKKTELFIDRDAERRNIQLLEPHGCGPVLYCCFSNGLCYSFTPGLPLTTATVTREEVYTATARHMARLHSVQYPGAHSEPMLFTKLRRFLSLLPDDFQKEDRLKTAVLKGCSKSYLETEMREVQLAVAALSCPVVLCHNDLLLGNIIWHQEDGTIQFIDFEYAAPNYQAFDVANHFCEFAGVDTSVDYDLYPSEEFQKKWIQRYLSSMPEGGSDLPLQWWLGAVSVLSLASHLFWGTWALLQALHSTIDFDFAEYAMVRLGEYRRRKHAFLAKGRALSAEQ